MLFFVKIGIVLIVAIFNFFLAVLVLVRNPKSTVNRVFFLLEFFFAAWCITLMLYENPIIFNSLFWIRATYVMVSIFISLLLGFSFVFPMPVAKKYWLLALVGGLIYIGTTFWLLNFTSSMVSNVVFGPSRGLQTILGPAYIWWITLTWIVLLWAVANFILKGTSASPVHRIQMRYMWAGFIAFGLAVCIPDVIIPLIWKDTRFFYISAICNIFFSLPVAYIIIKHRFLDIRLVVARSVTYLLLVITLALFYSSGLFIVGTYVIGESATTTSLLTSTVLTLISAFSFQPLLHFFEKLTKNIFYKDHYDTQKLLSSLSKIMSSTITLDELGESILKELIDQVKITSGSLVVADDQTIIWHKTIGKYSNITISGQELTQLRKSALNQSDNVLLFEELFEGEDKKIMNEHGLSAVLPLIVKNELIGVILFTEKSSGDVYSIEDVDLLKIIAPEIAVAIKNALSYEEIKRFNSTLEKQVKSSTEEIQQANTRLQDLDVLKDEFVSVASHELRTPMTAIKSYLWMALAGKGGSLTEKQKYYLDRAYNSTDRLIKLVNDMLNVSRIEAGRVSIEIQSVDMATLTEDVIAEVKPRSEELGVAIEIKNPESILPPVIADVDKIKEVFINLIGNSLKFTPAGGTITIYFDRKDNYIMTHIKDTGKGVDKEDIPKLFQKFGLMRGSYTTNQVSQGTGLGLYICKSIITLHKGDIWATSEGRDKGAEFNFSLPIFDQKIADDIVREQQGKEGIEIIPTRI